jgi:hypothetical protein
MYGPRRRARRPERWSGRLLSRYRPGTPVGASGTAAAERGAAGAPQWEPDREAVHVREGHPRDPQLVGRQAPAVLRPPVVIAAPDCLPGETRVIPQADGTREFRTTFVGLERVTVPLGTVPRALVMRLEMHGSDYVSEAVHHFAPHVGLVKYTYTVKETESGRAPISVDARLRLARLGRADAGRLHATGPALGAHRPSGRAGGPRAAPRDARAPPDEPRAAVKPSLHLRKPARMPCDPERQPTSAPCTPNSEFG